MAILPRYQRTGITTRQPQNLDFADVREQAKLNQTLSQQLDRMSNFAFQKAEEKAVERGEERVREEGAIPTLQSIEAGGGPRGVAEKAAAAAANRIAVVEIETLATQDMQALTLEADKDNMSMPTYQARMKDINDGYKASLEVVDPVAAGVLGARLAGSSSNYENRYSEVVFKKAKIAWAQKVNRTVSAGSQALIDSATQPGATEESLVAAGKKLQESQLALGVSDKKARTVVDSTMKVAVRQNRVYLFNEAAGINEKRSLIEQYEESPLPGVSYEANLNFVTAMQGKLNREVGAAQTEATTDLSAAMEALALTGEVPAGYQFDEAVIASVFPEEQADVLAETWEGAQEDAANRGALAYMDGSKIGIIARGLEEDLIQAKSDGSPLDIIRAQERVIAWEQSVSDRDDKITKDAASFVVSTNETVGDIVENTSIQFSRGKFEEATESLLMLREVVNGQYDDLGVPGNMRNIMPKPMANQLVNFIQSIEPDVAAQSFQSITDRLGDYSPMFIEELRSQGLPPEYVQAMYASKVTVKRELMELSNQSVKSITDNLPKGTEDEVIRAVNNDLSKYREAFLAGSYGPGNNIYNQQVETIEKLVFSRLKTGKFKNVGNAVSSVLDDLIPEYNQSVINNQGKYVVPIEFNQQTIISNVGLLMSSDAIAQLGIKPLDSPLVPTYIDEAVSYASLSSTGTFLNNSTGDGLALHYNISGDYLKSGFEVKFSELPGLVKELYSSVEILAEGTGYAGYSAAGARQEGLIQAGIAPEEAVEQESVVDPANSLASKIEKMNAEVEKANAIRKSNAELLKGTEGNN